ncbi:MAG: hypothetical protein M3290_11485 [Actinomycetota bacterium]|nr:hypothetical protein [Actinomycetota bacterium]
MAESAVIVGVTGIVVSGVVGPTVASWLARRARVRDFHREQVAQRRGELRRLLDEAASLLASGPTNIRILHEHRSEAEVEHAEDWLARVFPIGQRLQLWLPADHPVVASYERVREHLVDAAAAGPPPASDRVLFHFEEERNAFLAHARDALLSPIPETGAGL